MSSYLWFNKHQYKLSHSGEENLLTLKTLLIGSWSHQIISFWQIHQQDHQLRKKENCKWSLCNYQNYWGTKKLKVECWHMKKIT